MKITMDELEEKQEAIKRRMLAYSKDIAHKKDYDYVLINDNVENCFNELKKLFQSTLKIIKIYLLFISSYFSVIL